jgi:hypothetical protein
MSVGRLAIIYLAAALCAQCAPSRREGSADSTRANAPAVAAKATGPDSGGQDLFCGQHGPVPAPLITSDSIGTIDLHRTVADLRAGCPSAFDTVIAGEESRNPGLVFHLGGTTLTAQQVIGVTTTGLRATMPADLWTVVGKAGRLPDGLTLGSRWRELKAAFGPGVSGTWTESETAIRFCRFPRIFFIVGMGLPGDRTVIDSLPSFPDTMTVSKVVVMDSFLARTDHTSRALRPVCGDPASAP